MDYQSCCDWMFQRFPTFQKYGKTAFKPGLEKIETLTEHLHSTLESKTIIHIAGTNGKGSTSSLLASALSASGYKVGLFTSPHFLSFVERIQINGTYIPENRVATLINTNKTRIENLDASFFEISLWLALEHFILEEVDCIVLETGLGGRLDATNFIKQPALSIITNIGLDHTNILGDTLEKIAFEKGGIIKPNTPCLIGERQEEVNHVFTDLCSQHKSAMHYAESFDIPTTIKPQLEGQFQQVNAQTAYAACQVLKDLLPKLNPEHIALGINFSQSHFYLPGRWQKVDTSPLSVFDMGHNTSGVKTMLSQLEKENFDDLHVVWSMVSDKDVDDVFALLPKNATYYFCEMDNPRGLKQDALEKLGKKHELNFKCFPTPLLAINNSFSNSKKQDLILCGGSAFLISEVFETFFGKSLAELKKRSIFATVNNKKGN